MRRHQSRDKNQSGRQRLEATRQALEVYRAQVANAAGCIIALNRATLAKVSEVPRSRRPSLRWRQPLGVPRAYASDTAARSIEPPGAARARRRAIRKIEAISGEYRASYETTCEKLVSIYRETPRIDAASNNPD